MQAMPAGHHQKLGKGKALIIFRISRQNSNNSGKKSNGIVNWLVRDLLELMQILVQTAHLEVSDVPQM